MKKYDVIIVGAGASGLVAAAQLVQRKKNVLIIDMGNSPARKVAISGGGKCNFTNLAADFNHYFGKNPRFVCSALARWTPNNTLNWVRAHKIAVYEKEPGRYFCKNGSEDIINALLRDIGNPDIKYNTSVKNIEKNDDKFFVQTTKGDFWAKSIIIATGGLSYPHLGVSNIGHQIAKKFGHKIEPVRPALCAIKTKSLSSELSGISLQAEITINKKKIKDDLLFTHFGIGGPVAYRATLYGGSEMTINFAPDKNVLELLKSVKKENGKRTVANILSEILPNRLARFLCDDTRHIADLRDNELKQIATKVNSFVIDDASAIGMQSAEVTFGGVSTEQISSKTMESKLCNGLYFTGEVIDITGDLGGYNLQWAFSSGFVAGLNA
ncbi:MAG: aminoacetone oxidase family FAD-binding enzyme [Alphaproteobacteria bacterium]|nr:aminoacetone oxidase family FAD-binding enzyme [Alphaproteobacteria bacterium]